MTSIGAMTKTIPNDGRFFVPVSSLCYVGGINAKSATTGALTQATWMLQGAAPAAGGFGGVLNAGGAGSGHISSIIGPGAGRFRDLGKTYISAGRDFRKVQLVWYGSPTGATNGVNGAAATSPDQDYLTGYIELGWEGQGVPAPVARMGP